VVFLFVFPIFAKLLALPYGDYAKPAVVFATIKEISGHIFGTSTSTSIDFQDNSNLPSNFSDL
jgi:hypothetical protein